MDWRMSLEHWLKPFMEALKNPSRQAMCLCYAEALTGLGGRKST